MFAFINAQLDLFLSSTPGLILSCHQASTPSSICPVINARRDHAHPVINARLDHAPPSFNAHRRLDAWGQRRRCQPPSCRAHTGWPS